MRPLAEVHSAGVDFCHLQNEGPAQKALLKCAVCTFIRRESMCNYFVYNSMCMESQPMRVCVDLSWA